MEAGLRKALLGNTSSKINIPIGDRIYEFDCENESIAGQWRAAIETHFQ